MPSVCWFCLIKTQATHSSTKGADLIVKRPVNLALTTMTFPITAIISILHRASGVILFLFIPALLCILSCSLESPDGFASVQALFANVYVKILLWGVLAALLFHLLAGLRHLVMDLGWCEKLSTAKLTATIVFLLFAIGVVVMGVSLWA